MNRWFRMYDDLFNDPKILRLSDRMFRAWVTLLCIASKNDGKLPPSGDIALMLRIKPTKVAEWLTALTAGGLLDKLEGGGFAPHNWAGRQYKSDVTDPSAADRMRRYRANQRNERNATVTDKRPETEQITDADTEYSEAKASGAGAPSDPRSRLFDEGLKKFAMLTGKGPDSCRSFIGKCLKTASDDASVVLGLIEDAERNRVVDAGAWMSARLKTGQGAPVVSVELQIEQAVANFAKFGLWSRYAGPEPGQLGCKASPELLAKYGLGPDGRKLEPARLAQV
ncbi:MAG: hypothetical protein ACXU9C_04360 [Xanthobacteraceae bacterium]